MSYTVRNGYTRRLLREVDEQGSDLTEEEIDFVADLIDRGVSEFTVAEARRIERLHKRKVDE